MAKSEQFEEKKLSAKEKNEQRLDLRVELEQLERMIYDLKVEYEMFFMGMAPLAPEKLHKKVKDQLRKLHNAPFKNSAVSYKLRMLESRYQTYNNYWERINKQREEGTYSRDLFKADLREKIAFEEAQSQTAGGKAANALVELFKSYKRELEKSSSPQSQKLEFGQFRKALISRAKQLQEKHGFKKVSFQVAVKEGKITIQAKGK